VSENDFVRTAKQLADREGRRVFSMGQQEAYEHLERLTSVLVSLPEILEKQSVKNIAPFIHRVRQALECLQAQQVVADGMIEEHFFAPCLLNTSSGFPSSADYSRLVNDHRQAVSALESIPTEEEIIQSALDYIYSGRFPGSHPGLMSKRKYFEYLKTTSPIDHFALSDITISESDEEECRQCAIYAMGYLQGTGLPVFCTLYFEQERTSEPLDSSNIEESECGMRLLNLLKAGFTVNAGTLTTMNKIDEIDEFHPRMFEKVSLGPFYTGETDNPQDIREFFKFSTDTSDYIYLVNIDRCVSIGDEIVKSRRLGILTTETRKVKLAEPHVTQIFVVPYSMKQAMARNGIKTELLYAINERGELL